MKKKPHKTMKPIKKTTFVKIEHWDCGNENHRHKTEDVALRCIEKNKNKMPPRVSRHARNIYAAKEVVNGAKYKDVGEAIGVSSARANEIVRKILRIASGPRFGLNDPASARSPISEIRKHKDDWLERIDKVATFFKVSQ